MSVLSARLVIFVDKTVIGIRGEASVSQSGDCDGADANEVARGRGEKLAANERK